jgi:hypothetical protein
VLGQGYSYLRLPVVACVEVRPCQLSDGSEQERRESKGRRSLEIGFSQSHALKIFRMKHKAKVHTNLLPTFIFCAVLYITYFYVLYYMIHDMIWYYIVLYCTILYYISSERIKYCIIYHVSYHIYRIPSYRIMCHIRITSYHIYYHISSCQ